ncbi:hypothetical protein AB6A40_001273 [Gnathostoma spinigerum]|uniref:Uncharacterized protein n=1 Tax=Gnathostoma spinigerum TaxID=75299 RepID=A0ABD6E3S0_9BILA
MATNPVSCSQHPKPFLKKGEGATGRIMQQIRYPVLARRQSCQISPTQISVRDTGCETMDQNSHLSPVSSIEEHTTSLQYDMKVNQNDGATSTVEENENTNHEISESLSREHKSSSSQRPTTRTTDSGCPNDDYPDSVILSPDEAHKHTHNATICPDVSDVNASDAAQSINSNHGNTVQSIITGSSSKLEDVGLSLPLSSPRSEIVVDVSQPSIGESTVDFECVEKCLERSEINTPGGEYGGLLSDGSSASTDGTRSRYWKIGLRRFRREASKNQEFPSNYSTSNSAFSSRTPSTAASIDSSLPCSVSSKHSEESHALKLRRSTREGKPHPLKVQSVSTKVRFSFRTYFSNFW